MPNRQVAKRERASPLSCAGLGREPLDAFLVVVERLRNSGVRFVRPGGRDGLVLVVDASRRPERSLQPFCPDKRGGSPELEHVEHLARYVDPRVGRDLLADEAHREERGQIVGSYRLASSPGEVAGEGAQEGEGRH